MQAQHERDLLLQLALGKIMLGKIQSTVSGLGFRRVLGQGTFTPKPKPGASTRRTSRSMSLLGGANASSHIVPRWMQWNLELGEKQEIRSAIHSAVPQ